MTRERIVGVMSEVLDGCLGCVGEATAVALIERLAAEAVAAERARCLGLVKEFQADLRAFQLNAKSQRVADVFGARADDFDQLAAHIASGDEKLRPATGGRQS